MRPLNCLLLLTALVCLPSICEAQTVQLPTFSFFTVNTTVSVPDSGRAYVGGVRRASDGSISRGLPLLGKVPVASRLFRNRGIGSERDVSSLGVTAKIIDHAELDRAVLAEAARRRGGATSTGMPSVDEALRLGSTDASSERSTTHASDPPVGLGQPSASVAEIRRHQAAADRAGDARAMAYINQGKTLESKGKPAMARMYYNIAAQHASPTLKGYIEAHVRRMKLQEKYASKLAATDK